MEKRVLHKSHEERLRFHSRRYLPKGHASRFGCATAMVSGWPHLVLWNCSARTESGVPGLWRWAEAGEGSGLAREGSEGVATAEKLRHSGCRANLPRSLACRR